MSGPTGQTEICPRQTGVSIVIVNFKTEALVRLCLRSIRHFTRQPYEVIVVDNGSSGDASIDYLRQVSWIKLIERNPTDVAKNGAEAHKEATDIGFAAAHFPLLLAMHTDTIPIHEQWLDWLVAQLEADEKIGAAGSYKLEIKSPFRRFLKACEPVFGFGRGSAHARLQNPPYIRSHCALYRKDLLDKLKLRYQMPDTAGSGIHFGLLKAGYRCALLPVEEMLRYVIHLNHATLVLHPRPDSHQRKLRRGMRRIQEFFESPAVQAIYQNADLDR